MEDRFALEPGTPAGQRLVELGAKHGREFAPLAAHYDRSGRFPFEHFEKLQESGFLAGCVPESFGGLGVVRVQDYAAAVNRLARGDASTAIAANMHMIGGWLAHYLWRSASERGAAAAAERFAAQLRLLGSRKVIVSSANSEPGTLPHRPRTVAVPVKGGYRISGHKIFGTLAPAADYFMSLARVHDPERGDWMGSAMIPRDARGLVVPDNWDPLGMRASGSNDVRYEACFLPEDQLVPVGTWGRLTTGFYVFTLTNHICLCAAFLGIAEAAREHALDHLRSHRKLPHPGPRGENPLLHPPLAELEIDLSAARACLTRIAAAADEYFQSHPLGDGPDEVLLPLYREFQAVKHFTQRRAIRIVDRAMTLVGGGAYMAGHPLSRLYRDVRAGPFMQPFSPNEALGFIARVTLDQDPEEGL